MTDSIKKILMNRRQQGLIVLIASLAAGFLYAILIAPHLWETAASQFYGRIYFIAYQFFAAFVLLFGAVAGLWNFCREDVPATDSADAL